MKLFRKAKRQQILFPQLSRINMNNIYVSWDQNSCLCIVGYCLSKDQYSYLDSWRQRIGGSILWLVEVSPVKRQETLKSRDSFLQFLVFD